MKVCIRGGWGIALAAGLFLVTELAPTHAAAPASKLSVVLILADDLGIEFFDDMRVELYNLRDDIGEQHNLASQMPAKVEALRTRLHNWRKEVGAQMPSRNPAYDPSKPESDPAAKKKKVADK